MNYLSHLLSFFQCHESCGQEKAEASKQSQGVVKYIDYFSMWSCRLLSYSVSGVFVAITVVLTIADS